MASTKLFPIEMKHVPFQPFLALLLAFLLSCGGSSDDSGLLTAEQDGHTYQYLEGDLMKTRIYQLDNGMKVFLSDYKNEPRVHVFLAVKAGGKNDPSDNTGLAHYLEHMMFKGNAEFGTRDFEKEEVMLDSIETMFNHYATLEDTLERKAYYAQIDEYSNKAASHTIPNEYMSFISGIGGEGLNAYTSEDRTVYTVDIPSNELPRFLKMEGRRFRKIVNRLFHTELEAVYEEKNRTLDNDFWKTYEKLYAGLFPDHPYGTQTIIGTVDHLKNPSITEIKKFFDIYYRPNNVALCLSGDIDFSQTISLIKEHFGDWEPNNDLPAWDPGVPAPPKGPPLGSEVRGPDAESVVIGFRLPGRPSADFSGIQLIDMILSNSQAGLMDLNLLQQQLVLGVQSQILDMQDYSVHMIYGVPKQGQSLDEVRQLILDQIELIKKGEFGEWLLDAVVTDLKVSYMKSLEGNRSRADHMVSAFTNGISWADYVGEMDRLEKITKQELVELANIHYGESYVFVNKVTGTDTDLRLVEKPKISKIELNRDLSSAFVKELQEIQIPSIEPVFLDFDKDVERGEVSGVNIFSGQNDENTLFQINYLFETGRLSEPKLSMALSYLEYVGTSEMDAQQLKTEMYKLGCSYSVSAGDRRTTLSLSGLDENMESGMRLFESLLADPASDQQALDDLVGRAIKARSDAKKDKSTILWSALLNYAKYGERNPFNDVLSNEELRSLKAEEMVTLIQALPGLRHRILYYGPRGPQKFADFVRNVHQIPETFQDPPELVLFEEKEIDESTVYWANYDMVQSEFVFFSKEFSFTPSLMPQIRVFNDYFGRKVVFQEIREAQGLAYSVRSRITQPSWEEDSHYMWAYVGTQADKQGEALSALSRLLRDLPESKDYFRDAKSAILNSIRTNRVTRSQVLSAFVDAQDLGLEGDPRRLVYEKVKEMSLEDIMAFHQQHLRDNKYALLVVGSIDKIDFDDLKKYGYVKPMDLDKLFGYSQEPDPQTPAASMLSQK